MPRKIFVASGSGGTVAGLLLGLMATGCPAQVVAIRAVDRIVSPASKLKRLIARTLGLLEMPRWLLPAVLERLDRIDNRYLGKGYRDIPAAASQAVAAVHAHGLLLEPAFTGKAMACLLDELPDSPRGELLFWNTHDQRGAGNSRCTLDGQVDQPRSGEEGSKCAGEAQCHTLGGTGVEPKAPLGVRLLGNS